MKKIKNFLKEVRLFLRKEDRKVFSVFFLSIKVFFSAVFVILLPIFLFLVYIFIEPREIQGLNIFLKEKINDIQYIEKFEFKDGKVFLDSKLNFGFIIDDLKIKSHNEFELKLPAITIKMSLAKLIFKKIKIDSIIVENLKIKLNDNVEKTKNNKQGNLTARELIVSKIRRIFKYIHKKKLPVNDIILKNSNIELSEDKKIILNNVVLNLNNYFSGEKLVKVYSSISIDNKDNKIILNGKCNFLENRDVICNAQIRDFEIKNVLSVSKEFNLLKEYENGINSDFNGKFYIKLNHYINLENLDFVLYAKKGELNLKHIFGDRVNYKNLKIVGNAKDNFEYFNLFLKDTDFVFNNYKDSTKFSMLLEKYKDEDNIDNLKLNFDILSAPMDKLYVLWPVFLSQNGIRDWVIESLSKGVVEKAFAYMNFKKNYDTNDFDLEKIDSKLKFTGSTLKYSDFLPSLNNINAEAVFTINDMNVLINSGNFDNTKLTNSSVYLDFNKKKPIINIKANGNGLASELFYFIDNNKKAEIKNIVENYINGDAISTVSINVPLDKDDVDLKDIEIDANVVIKNNNTMLLNGNSTIKVNSLKKENENIFRTKIDLLNSNLYFPFISLDKEKGLKSSLGFFINVNDPGILINDFSYNESDFLKLNGEIFIDNGNIKKVVLNDINYLDNDFNFKFFVDDVGDSFFKIYGNKINLTKDLKKSYQDFKAFFLGEEGTDNNKNLYFNLDVNNISYNEFGNFYNNKIDFFLTKSSNFKLDIFSNYLNNNFLKINKNLENEKNFTLKISNIGELLNKMNITNKILGGNLELNGNMNEKFELNGDINIKDKFNFLTSTKHNNRIFRSLLNDNLIPLKTKKIMMENNGMEFSSLQAEIFLTEDFVKIKNLIAYGGIIGIDLTMNGKYYFNSKNMDFEGLIIPAGVINRLFFIDKIPLLNSIILGGKDGALFAIQYVLEKNSINEDLNFKIKKSSVLAPGFLRTIINKIGN